MDMSLLKIENRDSFILENKVYIYRICCKTCKRPLNWENDEELSIAMVAFNKACDTYKEENGEFLGYAAVVIKNSLIDYFRKSSKNPYLTYGSADDEKITEITDKKSKEEYFNSNEASFRAEEIVRLTKVLKEFDIDFSKLVDNSPKHQDTRENVLRIVIALGKHENIMENIMKTKKLPIKEIMSKLDLSKKLLDKWRKYILALLIVLYGDYPYIKSYLNIKAGDKNV